MPKIESVLLTHLGRIFQSSQMGGGVNPSNPSNGDGSYVPQTFKKPFRHLEKVAEYDMYPLYKDFKFSLGGVEILNDSTLLLSVVDVRNNQQQQHIPHLSMTNRSDYHATLNLTNSRIEKTEPMKILRMDEDYVYTLNNYIYDISKNPTSNGAYPLIQENIIKKWRRVDRQLVSSTNVASKPWMRKVFSATETAYTEDGYYINENTTLPWMLLKTSLDGEKISSMSSDLTEIGLLAGKGKVSGFVAVIDDIILCENQNHSSNPNGFRYTFFEKDSFFSGIPKPISQFEKRFAIPNTTTYINGAEYFIGISPDRKHILLLHHGRYFGEIFGLFYLDLKRFKNSENPDPMKVFRDKEYKNIHSLLKEGEYYFEFEAKNSLEQYNDQSNSGPAVEYYSPDNTRQYRYRQPDPSNNLSEVIMTLPVEHNWDVVSNGYTTELHEMYFTKTGHARYFIDAEERKRLSSDFSSGLYTVNFGNGEYKVDIAASTLVHDNHLYVFDNRSKKGFKYRIVE